MAGSKKSRMKLAAETLAKEGHFSEAFLMYWQLLRTKILSCNYSKGLFYNSTEEGLALFLNSLPSKELKASVHFLYSTAILAEWDPNFSISMDDFEVLSNNIGEFEKIINYGL